MGKSAGSRATDFSKDDKTIVLERGYIYNTNLKQYTTNQCCERELTQGMNECVHFGQEVWKSDTTLIKFKCGKKSKLTDLSSRNNFIKTQETQMDYEWSSIKPIFQSFSFDSPALVVFNSQLKNKCFLFNQKVSLRSNLFNKGDLPKAPAIQTQIVSKVLQIHHKVQNQQHSIQHTNTHRTSSAWLLHCVSYIAFNFTNRYRCVLS